MAISLAVTGNGAFQGSSTNLSDYSVTEDATPIEGSDTSGGTGTIDFSVVEVPASDGSILLLNDTVLLTDGSNGTTTGTVYSVSSDDGISRVSANSRINAAAANIVAAPYTGILDGALTYYLSLIGITSGIVIDSSLSLVRSNLLNNPSARRGFGGYSQVGGTLVSEPGFDVYLSAAGVSTAGNLYIALEAMTIGAGKLLANTVYTYSASIYANATSVSIFAGGAGVVGGGAQSAIQSAGGGMLRQSVTFTTTASGAVTFYVLNSSTTAAGNLIAIRDAQVELGPVATSYFDGSLPPASDKTSFRWTGAVDNSVSTNARYVSYQNFSGSMWDYLKQLCVAQQIEISLVSNNVVVRPIRSRIAYMQKNSKVSTSVANSDLAQTVQAWAYNNVRQTNTTMYPLGGNTNTVSAYQVDSGKTLTENIPVNVSIETLSQPVCVATSTLSPTYNSTSSVYGVSGQDGTPIAPSAWMAAGGSVSVAVGADGKSIDLTIVAPTGLANAPFTIGVSNGPSSYYAGLFISGTGVFFTPVLYTTATGSPLARTATIIGATVNNIFMSSAADAGSAMLATAQRWAAPKQTISVSATVVNRPGDKGDASYPTFANFDAATSGTFAAFDTAQSGQSFVQFNAAQQLLVANNFENQAFGNIAGARVQYRDAWYRITTATISPSIITYTATADTIFSDFDTAWAGKTFANFTTRWTGKAFADNAVIPLWT